MEHPERHSGESLPASRQAGRNPDWIPRSSRGMTRGRWMVTSFLISFFLSLAIFGASGCGYTQKAVMPNGIQTIGVPTFKDEIPPENRYAYREGLEIELTNAVIDRLIFDGNLKVVDPSEADAVLEGSVVAYEQEGLRFDRLENVDQYRLFLVVKLKLVDSRTRKVLIDEPNFSGRSEFFVSRSPAGVRRTAANDAVTDIARSIVSRIVENW